MSGSRTFVPLDEILHIGEVLAAQARKCGDHKGADAIELFKEEISNAVAATLHELNDGDVRNGKAVDITW